MVDPHGEARDRAQVRRSCEQGRIDPIAEQAQESFGRGHPAGEDGGGEGGGFRPHVDVAMLGESRERRTREAASHEHAGALAHRTS